MNDKVFVSKEFLLMHITHEHEDRYEKGIPETLLKTIYNEILPPVDVENDCWTDFNKAMSNCQNIGYLNLRVDEEGQKWVLNTEFEKLYREDLEKYKGSELISSIDTLINTLYQGS